MKKIICKMTVKQLVFGFYLISVAVFFGILLFGFIRQQNDMIEQNSVGFETLITQMTQNVEDKCHLYNNMLTKMAYTKSAQSWLEEDFFQYDLEEKKMLIEYLDSYISLDDTILDVALFSTSGKQLNLKADISQIKQACAEIPEKTPYYYTGVKEINVSLSYPRVKECILVGTRIYSMTTFDREHPIGTIVLVLDAEKLLNLTGGEKLGTVMCCLFDRDSNIFCNNSGFESEELSWEKISENDDYMILNGVTYCIKKGEVSCLQSQIVLMISEKELLRNVHQLRKNQILLFGLALLVELLLFYISVSSITRPINQLVVFLVRTEKMALQP